LLVCWVQVSPFGTTRLHTHGTPSMAGLQEEWKQQALKAGYEEVRCKVALWSLGNVDLVQGSFDCKFRVTTWWSPARQQRDAIAAAVEAGSTKQLKCEVLTRDKGEVPFAGGSIKVDIPPLALHNAMVFESDTSGAELHAIEPQPTRVLLRWTCMYIGTFSDVPCDDELYPFPYDHHWLEIHLGVSFGPFVTVPIKPAVGEDNMRALRPGQLAYCQIEPSIHLSEFLLGDAMRMRAGLPAMRSNTVCFELFIWRRFKYLELNILKLNMLITLVGMGVFVYPPSNFSGRFGFGVVLLFSLLAIRSAADSLVPKLDFESVAHRLLNVSIFFSVMIMAESAIFGVLAEALGEDEDGDRTIEGLWYLRVADGGIGALVLVWLLHVYGIAYRCRAMHVALKPEQVQRKAGKGALLASNQKRP